MMMMMLRMVVAFRKHRFAFVAIARPKTTMTCWALFFFCFFPYWGAANIVAVAAEVMTKTLHLP
jgi:hypothetical protein